MHYATPEWMERQLPDWMFDKYEVIIVPYGTPITDIKSQINPSTTAIIGFSAGGIDVLKNYNKNYAFVGLIDPSTRGSYVNTEYGKNTYMMYNPKNWGGANKSLSPVGKRVAATGGTSVLLNMKHSDIPKYFFETYFKHK